VRGLLLGEQLPVMGCWMLLEARDPPLVAGLKVCLFLALLFPVALLFW
jgi:hypothetical protein